MRPPIMFRFTLVTVTALTLMSGGAAVWIASSPQEPSSAKKKILEVAIMSWALNTASISSLLNSSSTPLTNSKKDDDN